MNKTTEALLARIEKLEAANKLAEEALNAMLTHMGMDEDEWTKPTFNQAREALAAIREALAEPVQEPVALGNMKYVWDAALADAIAHSGNANETVAEPVKQEPVATEHPLVAYAESYEQIARSGSSGKVSALAVATDIRQNMIPLTAANVDLSNAATLSASKQEPVAKVTDVFPTRVEWLREVAVNSLLYAAPVSAKREWVYLTDDELKAALEVHQVGLSVRIGRIAIAAFKEKNK